MFFKVHVLDSIYQLGCCMTQFAFFCMSGQLHRRKDSVPDRRGLGDAAWIGQALSGISRISTAPSWLHPAE